MIGFYVCLNKTGFIEHSELNMVILIYQPLILTIFTGNKLNRTVLRKPQSLFDVTGC